MTAGINGFNGWVGINLGPKQVIGGLVVYSRVLVGNKFGLLGLFLGNDLGTIYRGRRLVLKVSIGK